MSLKDLIKTAKKSMVKKEATPTNTGGNIAFSALEYNLHHKPTNRHDLTAILEDMLDALKANNTIHEQDKKRFILTFFRLAFTQEARAKGCFHPSEISTEDNLCNRKLYFQKARLEVDETYVNFTSDNRMMRLVDLGTIMHLYIQENLNRNGVLKDFEVPVSFPEYGIEGKTDGVVEFVGLDDLQKYYSREDMVLEVKTINEYGFKSLRKAKPEHIRQASIYGHLLGYSKICFLYYNKNTSEHKVFVHEVDVEYVENFKELGASIIKKYNSNVRSARSLDLNLHDLPDRICHNRTTKRAMECAFADSCFKFKN